MKYFSKDLTLKQINSFINYSFHELKDTLIEKFNENYWDDKKITKKEFNYLIDVYEFDESFKSRVFAGYARTLIYRAKEINDELTENKRKEFIEYIFKNQVLFDYLKPQLIELNLDKEAVAFNLILIIITDLEIAILGTLGMFVILMVINSLMWFTMGKPIQVILVTLQMNTKKMNVNT